MFLSYIIVSHSKYICVPKTKYSLKPDRKKKILFGLMDLHDYVT